MTYLRPHSENFDARKEDGFTGLVVGGTRNGEQFTCMEPYVSLPSYEEYNALVRRGFDEDPPAPSTYEVEVYHHFEALRVPAGGDKREALDLWVHEDLTYKDRNGRRVMDYPQVFMKILDGFVSWSSFQKTDLCKYRYVPEFGDK